MSASRSAAAATNPATGPAVSPASAGSPAVPARTSSLPLDPAALMRIRSLELRARVIVEGFWSGLHRSPYHGFSVEFSEYRPYTVGDDPRYLDWKLFARSDRYFIKKFEDETNLRCHLLVDQSRSLQFGTRGYTKAEYAITLAATLAHFLAGQRDAVGLVTFAETLGEYIPPRHRPGHLRRLLLALERKPAGRGTDLAAPLRHVAEIVRRRGLMLLISDFLTPLASLEEHLGMLRARGHDVVLWQVLDPAEVTFDFAQPALFHDLESGRELYVDPAEARQTYLERFSAHQAGLQTICDQLGLELQRFTLDQPLEMALFDFLRSREQRGKFVRRAGSARRERSS